MNTKTASDKSINFRSMVCVNSPECKCDASDYNIGYDRM